MVVVVKCQHLNTSKSSGNSCGGNVDGSELPCKAQVVEANLGISVLQL